MRTSLAALIAILGIAHPCLVQESKRSFADVPTGHWAAKAVEFLHQECVLVGYPSGQVTRFAKVAKYDGDNASQIVERWDRKGLLIVLESPYARKNTAQDFADHYFQALSAWAVSDSMLTRPAWLARQDSRYFDNALSEVRSLAFVLSMCAPELKLIGANANDQIQRLEQLVDRSGHTVFRGD